MVTTAGERCPPNYSRFVQDGKCIDDALLGLLYFLLGCCACWLWHACFVTRQQAVGQSEGGDAGDEGHGESERRPLTTAV